MTSPPAHRMNDDHTNGTDIDLIAFDVDGTLVEHPQDLVIWQLLNDRFGADRARATRRFHDFQAGRIDYATWVALDVSDWIEVGATREEILEEVRKLRPVPGARAVLDRLKARGYRLAVISGTIDIVLDEFFPAHPFDAVYTNRILFAADGRLSGWEATRYDVDGKVRALHELALQADVPVSRCAFIGDNFNDVAVAREAGFSVGFNPKTPELESAVDVVVRSPRLDSLLEIFPGPNGC